MEKVVIQCYICKKSFERAKKEVSRNMKKGTKTICSIECQKEWGRMTVKLRKNNIGNKNLWITSGNRHDEYSQFRVFFKRAIRYSKKRKMPVTMTLNDLKTQWEKQNGKCAITQLQMDFYHSTHYKNNHLTLKTASLDRKDSSIGYTPENIQYVCYAINMAKNKFSDDELKSFISEIRPVVLPGLEPGISGL